jgi:hypothetical protein
MRIKTLTTVIFSRISSCSDWSEMRVLRGDVFVGKGGDDMNECYLRLLAPTGRQLTELKRSSLPQGFCWTLSKVHSSIFLAKKMIMLPCQDHWFEEGINTGFADFPAAGCKVTFCDSSGWRSITHLRPVSKIPIRARATLIAYHELLDYAPFVNPGLIWHW